MRCLGTLLALSIRELGVQGMPELPDPAEISHQLFCKSSTVPGKSAVFDGMGSAAPQQLILPSSLTVKPRVKAEQWTASFNKQPNQRKKLIYISGLGKTALV